MLLLPKVMITAEYWVQFFLRNVSPTHVLCQKKYVLIRSWQELSKAQKLIDFKYKAYIVEQKKKSAVTSKSVFHY